MYEGLDLFFASGEEKLDEVRSLIGRLFDVASPQGVFGEPVTAEGYTVITASEVTTAMGFGQGYGAGFGPETPSDEEEENAEDAPSAEPDEPAQSDAASGFPAGIAGGSGGGGGGGGFSAGRPVAVISIGPDGVKVEPVVDVTKLGIAFFTMFGTLAVMVSRMRQAAGNCCDD